MVGLSFESIILCIKTESERSRSVGIPLQYV